MLLENINYSRLKFQLDTDKYINIHQITENSL